MSSSCVVLVSKQNSWILNFEKERVSSSTLVRLIIFTERGVVWESLCWDEYRAMSTAESIHSTYGSQFCQEENISVSWECVQRRKKRSFIAENAPGLFSANVIDEHDRRLLLFKSRLRKMK